MPPNGLRYPKTSKKENKKKMSSIKMKSKYKGTCRVCKKNINPGDSIWWNKTTKQVSHPECFEKKVYLGKTHAYPTMTKPHQNRNKNIMWKSG